MDRIGYLSWAVNVLPERCAPSAIERALIGGATAPKCLPLGKRSFQLATAVWPQSVLCLSTAFTICLCYNN